MATRVRCVLVRFPAPVEDRALVAGPSGDPLVVPRERICKTETNKPKQSAACSRSNGRLDRLRATRYLVRNLSLEDRQ